MSYDKITRAKRRAKTQRVIERQTEVFITHIWAQGAKGLVPGRFRKHKALDCGKSKCSMCGNARRVWGHLTFAEHRANEALRQDLLDI